MRITAACPDALAAAANALAAAIGQSEADALTYSAPNFRDGQGNLYRVASFIARPDWVSWVLYIQSLPDGSLTRPAWDSGEIDLSAAEIALDALTVGDAPAAPTRIQTVINEDPQAAIAILGLTLLSGAY